MLMSIDEMPESARVWVYQANREITEKEQDIINAQASQFFGQWVAHGNPLKSAYKISHSRFLIILVDESFNQASGCSIDASVHFVQQVQRDLGIDFFDRTKVVFLQDNEISINSIGSIKTKVQEGAINRHTLTFNNLIATKKEMDEKWLLPAEKTWLSRYF